MKSKEKRKEREREREVVGRAGNGSEEERQRDGRQSYSRVADGTGSNSGEEKLRRVAAVVIQAKQRNSWRQWLEETRGETFHRPPPIPIPCSKACHCIRVPDRLTPRRMAVRTGFCCTPHTRPLSRLLICKPISRAQPRNYIASQPRYVSSGIRLPDYTKRRPIADDARHLRKQFFPSNHFLPRILPFTSTIYPIHLIPDRIESYVRLFLIVVDPTRDTRYSMNRVRRALSARQSQIESKQVSENTLDAPRLPRLVLHMQTPLLSFLFFFLPPVIPKVRTRFEGNSFGRVFEQVRSLGENVANMKRPTIVSTRA